MGKQIIEEIRNSFFSIRDQEYAKFQAKLIPNIPPESVIGVRTPMLKKMAKEYSKNPDIQYFLSDLPHTYFEENQLHSFLLSEIKDFSECLKQVNIFLPYVDNWATSDQMHPKVFAKHASELLPEVDQWINSGHTYKIRYGIDVLMTYFWGDNFEISYAERVASIQSNEYYVNMMSAWYFATALAKNYEQVMPFILDKKLPVWVHNKAIQKSIESNRIPDAVKTELRTLKIKKSCS